MQCKCGEEMMFVFLWDNAQQTEHDHAYNLYTCNHCGRMCKEDVWTDAGQAWLEVEKQERTFPLVTEDNLFFVGDEGADIPKFDVEFRQRVARVVERQVSAPTYRVTMDDTGLDRDFHTRDEVCDYLVEQLKERSK